MAAVDDATAAMGDMKVGDEPSAPAEGKEVSNGKTIV